LGKSCPVFWQTAHGFIAAVFSFPNARILLESPLHAESLKHVMEQSEYTRGHFIHDCHIAALLYENGIRTIITADQDFRRFDFLDIIDPTASR
jgi:predicted nucleic acid-binding protein